MKAELKFNLNTPEDRRKYMIHVFAEELHGNYLDLDNKMRNLIKYGECEITAKLAQEVRDDIREGIEGLWGLE